MTDRMAASSEPGHRRRDAVAIGLIVALALLVGTELARPFRSASIAFDSQVAVLHFERIMAGRHLESFIATTPKPLLTVLFGSLHWLTGGWAAIAWATIGAYAVAVGLAAILAWRLAGPIAGAFSALAVLASPGLLFDVGFALATPWAAVGWLVAGLALTAHRPRYALAGVALLLATLARLETVVAVGVMILALGTAWLVDGRSRGVASRPPKRAWLVPLIALIALPLMMIHDWLLTGDPFFWASVAGRYSAATRLAIMTPIQVLEFLVGRYWASGALTLLAIIGVGRLVRTRQWSTLVGLGGLGPGIALFLVVLAARGIFVSDRYATAIDVTVAFTAGIGAADVTYRAARLVRATRLTQRLELRLGAGSVSVVAAAIAAILIAGPYWIVDPDLRPAVHRSSRLAADEEAALPALLTGLTSLEHSMGGATGGNQVSPLVYAPLPIRPRLIVDLALATTQIGTLDAAALDLAAGYPPAGVIVFHSLAGDGTSPRWADLETSTPTQTGGVTIRPLLTDQRAGFWVMQVAAGGTSQARAAAIEPRQTRS